MHRKLDFVQVGIFEYGAIFDRFDHIRSHGVKNDENMFFFF